MKLRSYRIPPLPRGKPVTRQPTPNRVNQSNPSTLQCVFFLSVISLENNQPARLKYLLRHALSITICFLTTGPEAITPSSSSAEPWAIATLSFLEFNSSGIFYGNRTLSNTNPQHAKMYSRLLIPYILYPVSQLIVQCIQTHAVSYPCPSERSIKFLQH